MPIYTCFPIYLLSPEYTIALSTVQPQSSLKVQSTKTIMKPCNIFFRDYLFLKFAFFVFTVVLLIQQFLEFLIVKPTYTSLSKHHLEPKHFPDMTICPFPSFNRTILNEYGYANSFDYARGKERSKKFIGWRGRNSSDIEDIILKASTFKTVQDCPTAAILLGKDGQSSTSVSFTLSQALHPSGVCCKAIIPQEAHNHTVSGIIIYTNKLDMMENFKVFLSGQESATYFQKNKFNINGAYLEAKSGTGYSLYRIKVMEEISLESDPNFGCENYPEAGDYAKCLEAEYVEHNHEVFPCTPPWLTQDKSQWCDRVFYNEYTEAELKKFDVFLTSIINERKENEKCLPPCSFTW